MCVIIRQIRHSHIIRTANSGGTSEAFSVIANH